MRQQRDIDAAIEFWADYQRRHRGPRCRPGLCRGLADVSLGVVGRKPVPTGLLVKIGGALRQLAQRLAENSWRTSLACCGSSNRARRRAALGPRSPSPSPSPRRSCRDNAFSLLSFLSSSPHSSDGPAGGRRISAGSRPPGFMSSNESMAAQLTILLVEVLANRLGDQPPRTCGSASMERTIVTRRVPNKAVGAKWR